MFLEDALLPCKNHQISNQPKFIFIIILTHLMAGVKNYLQPKMKSRASDSSPITLTYGKVQAQSKVQFHTHIVSNITARIPMMTQDFESSSNGAYN